MGSKNHAQDRGVAMGDKKHKGKAKDWLSKAKPEDRALLTLLYGNSMKTEEDAAEELGLPIVDVRTSHKRLRKAIFKSLFPKSKQEPKR